MWAAVLAWIRRHAVATYCVLAFAITWLLVSPLVSDGLGLTHLRLPAAWHAFGAAGQIVAAAVVTALVGGRVGLRLWWGALGRWRVGLGWALVAVLSPFALSAVLLRLMGQPWPDVGLLASQFANPAWVFGALLAAAVYGVGEEPGWRGFVLPRLQRRWNALVAALGIGSIWALWHVPYFTYRYQMSGVTVVFFVLGVLAGSIWLTTLYNATRGSVLMVMAWHVSWNVVNALAAVVSGSLVALLTAEVMVAAVVVVVIWKPAHLAPASAGARDQPPSLCPG